MNNAKVRFRGLNSPDRVLQFFLKKKHKYIVIEIADLLKMDLPSKAEFLDLLYQLGLEPEPSGSPPIDAYRSRIQRLGFNGYLRVNIQLLCKTLSIEKLQQLQKWLSLYREIRKEQNKPIQMEICECQSNPKCNICGGQGEIKILTEMSHIEEQLAQGKEWREINVN